MPGCIVSATTASFRSVEKRRLRATPVSTSTFENVSDIGVSLGLYLGPPAIVRVRSKRGAVQGPTWSESFCRRRYRVDLCRTWRSGPGDNLAKQGLRIAVQSLDPAAASLRSAPFRCAVSGSPATYGPPSSRSLKPRAFTRATLLVPAPHSLRQHGPEGVVAAPEMVVERRRRMKRNQAEEKEPDRLVRLAQLPSQRPVAPD